MATFNIHEAKTNFSRLVDEAAAGKEVVIARAGKPVAKLVSISAKSGKKQPRQLGQFAGKYKIPEVFYEPLPEEVLADFETPLFSLKKR